MLEIGKFYDLKIVKILDFGAYLDAGDTEILLPTKYIPIDAEVGQTVRVFLYKDSENRPVATTQTPKITLDHFACLEVKDVNKYGAFLDWGIENQLLVPFAEQPTKLLPNKRYVVRLLLDNLTERLIATAKIEKYLSKYADETLSEGLAVELLVYSYTDLGYKAIVNDRFIGVIYDSDVYREIRIGDRLSGTIKKIREDKKIDLTIRKTGVSELEENKDVIFGALLSKHGYLPLNDNSSPEEIETLLHMSKKTFKRSVGMLLKEGKIAFEKGGIVLLNKG